MSTSLEPVTAFARLTCRRKHSAGALGRRAAVQQLTGRDQLGIPSARTRPERCNQMNGPTLDPGPHKAGTQDNECR
jgi:hypothetical protein